MSEVFPVLGYDIGGTKIAIGLCSSDGKLYGKDRIDNKDTDPDVILPLLVERGQKLIDAAGFKNSDIKGVGIASPSPSDIPQGIIVGPPNNKHWKNVHIKHYLSKKLGIEGFFDNDANAGVLAEWFFGAGKGGNNIMYLTMSTGIGFGIAIPHASSDRVTEVVAAFGRSSSGIEFDSLDNLPVKFIVLFIVPKDQFQTHLRTLAAIAKFLNDRAVRERLAVAPGAREILEIFEAPGAPGR